ncbi:MAG: C40 family peptidase [Clostridiales bacterium]|nr:C40 family peptidase [Clostridiales bacterium]
MQGANIDKLIRYARPVKIATVALGCVITVASIVVSNCGSSDSVSLQMPARYTEDRSSRLGYVDTKPAHQRFDLDKYTYVADDVQFALENFKQEEPSAELKYDGNKYRVEKKTVKLYSDAELSEELTKLKADDVVVVISCGDDIAYVKTENGQRGYMKSSALADEPGAVTPTPTATATPTPTPKAKDNKNVNAKATATPTQSPKATATPAATATATPKPTAAPTATATPKPAADDKKSDVTEKKCDKTVYTTDSVNLRMGPGTDFDRAKVIASGTELKCVALTSNGWYKTSDGYYVRADLTTDQKPDAGQTDQNDNDNQDDTKTKKVTGGNKSDYSDFASFVKSFIGVRYVFAACAIDKVDCSGLTKYCFSKWYGLDLPHSAHEQSKMGTEVAIDSIKCADIVCFDYNQDGRIDHVGIYVGGGVVIHASETKGAVRASSLSGMSGIATIRRLV